MKHILEFLYMMNLNLEISDELILEAYQEILNIKDKEKSNIFISTLFTYLMLKKKNIKLIVKLLEKSFEKDKFIPYHEKLNTKNKNPIILLAGSGKKGIKTINISTTSAIVAISLGANIIKPCSMATSSMSGSFDFLNMVGVNTQLSIEETKKIFDETRFGLFAIEKLVPRFDSVYGNVFYAPNILSYGLAALICPIKPDIVLYGLANKDIELSGQVLRGYNVNRYRIVSSEYNNIFFMDELNFFGKSYILDENMREKSMYEFQKMLKLDKYDYDANSIKQLDNKKDNINIALNILKGKDETDYCKIIALNTGNILQLSGIVDTIEEGYYKALEKIKTGECIYELEKIIITSGGDINKLLNFKE